MNRMTKAAPVAVLAVLLLTASSALGSGGGTVTNKLPTVPTFTHTGAATVNQGSLITVEGTVRDTNGEQDLVNIKVESTGAAALTSTRALVAGDLTQTTEPAFASGWKVWNTAANDGILNFKVQFTLNTVGSYTFTAYAQDEGAYQASVATVVITASAKITLAADPVNAAGAAQVGARWGAWSAEPLGTAVSGVNYIKVTNTGTTANQQFTVDFTDIQWTGVTTSSFTINLDSNIKFAWAEFASGTPPSGTPVAGDINVWGSTSGTGSVAPQFTGTGNVIYIKYQMVAFPDALKDQDYQASYTVNAV